MKVAQYIVLHKRVGETPLACVEAWRVAQPPAYQTLPLSYAGRLDPMASGKLLVLIGTECKKQKKYHTLDKEYEFSVLLGVNSDTGDVLGRLHNFDKVVSPINQYAILPILNKLTGKITLPYPHFSAKTVAGKPLHVWTLENRLDEIIIPTWTSTIYKLTYTGLRTSTRADIYAKAIAKINEIPKVTAESKKLGNDFRRVDIRADWQKFLLTGRTTDPFTIIDITCICSAGTYMRSLAKEIAKELNNTPGLAYHIHRTQIGKYKKILKGIDGWIKSY